MKNILKLSALLAFAVFCGCSDSASNSGVKGTMVGYVITHDTGSIGYNDTISRSGVYISVEGTDRYTTTDKIGRWELKDVMPGTYNISFTKDGFATEKIIAYPFVGNGTSLFSSPIDLWQIAKRNSSLILRSFEDRLEIHYDIPSQTFDTVVYPLDLANFSCRIFRNNSDESLYGGSAIFFARNENINPLDPNTFLYSQDNYGSTPLPNGYSFDIYRNNLINAGFQSGERIYCQAFVSNLYRNTYNPLDLQVTAPSYFDIASGKQIYTGFGDNHSEVKSFILP